MNTKSKILLALLASFSTPLFADTVFLTNGNKLEGTVVSRNDKGVNLRVKYGMLILAASKIERVEFATKDANESREKADAADISARDESIRKNIENGKVFYQGAWVTVAEKLAAERIVAAAQHEKAIRDQNETPPPANCPGNNYDSGFGGYVGGYGLFSRFGGNNGFGRGFSHRMGSRFQSQNRSFLRLDAKSRARQ